MSIIMNLFHNSMIKEESNANVMFLSCSGFLMKESMFCDAAVAEYTVMYCIICTQKLINYFNETRRSKDILTHRYNIMYRVSSFLCSRPNWVPRTLTRKEVLLPHFGSKGVDTLALAGEGVGGPNSDEMTDTGTLCRL